MQAFGAVLQLFLIMALGFFAGKLRILTSPVMAGVNRLIMVIALPCLLLTSLQDESDLSMLPSLAVMLLVSLLSMLASLGLALCIFHRCPRDSRNVYAHLSTFSNCGFMGYPIVIAAFGQSALIYAVMYNVAFNLVIWSAGQYLYMGKMEAKKLVRAVLLQPSMLASILSIILFLLQFRFPDILLSGLETVGSLTTPLSMMVIGARLTQMRLSAMRDLRLLLASLLRLVIMPLCALYLLRLFGVPTLVSGVCAVCMMMPGSAISAMLAEASGQHDIALKAAGGMAVTTALSVVSIPLMMLLL